jgi:MFS family permease
MAADSAQYSTMISEMIADRSLVVTALTLQTGSGFLISVISVFLIPVLSRYISWTWLFAILTPGSLFSIGCMIRIILMQRRVKTPEVECINDESNDLAAKDSI